MEHDSPASTTPIRGAEDRLFEEWRAGGPSFHPDGLVNEHAYASAPVRLLFILKEVNDPGEGFDLRDFLREGARPQTWDNVTRWVEGIIRLAADGTVAPWADLQEVGQDRRARVLGQIGAVNLKKAAGVHTTNIDELTEAADADADDLRAQLALYRADFTICCGSAVTDVVQCHQLLDGHLQKHTWRHTQRGIAYHEAGQHGVVIDYSHPAARVAPNLLLYGLLDAVAEIRAVGTR